MSDRNPWDPGQREPQDPKGNFGAPQPGQPFYGAPAVSSRQSRTGLIIGIIVGVLGLGLVTAAALLLLQGSGDTDAGAAAISPPSLTSAAVDPEGSGETDQDTVPPAEETTPETTAATVTTTVTAQETTPMTQASPTVSSPTPDLPGNLPPGLTSQGWSQDRGAHCNADDHWIYAAGDGSDFVAVCRSNASGGLYYRGAVFGGGYEADVAASNGHDYFEVPAAPNTIVIDGTTLRVLEGATSVSTVNFPAAYTR